jgi:hypothetical protein
MKIFKVLALVSIVLFLFSCKDDGIIDQVTFKVTVVNNTADELTVFWNIDNSGFEQAGKVSPNGGSFDVQPVTIDTDNVIEVRQDDGTVVASGSYNQPDDTDRTLTVD